MRVVGSLAVCSNPRVREPLWEAEVTKRDDRLKRRAWRGRKTGSMILQQLYPVSETLAEGVVGLVQAEELAFPPSEGLGTLAEFLRQHDTVARSGGVVCPCCRGTTRRVVRARPGNAARWVAVCAMCAGKLLAGHPGTVVGGRIRPRLRRAG